MGCSGKKSGNWCNNLPVHYVDSAGKSYCLFHTPRGKKKLASGKEFNIVLLEKITSDLIENRSCNLSGTVFDWDIDLKAVPIKELIGNIDFSNAIFFGEVNMKRKVFTGHVDFTGAVFHKTSDFDCSNFVGTCSFKNATFEEKPYFFDTIFNEAVDFSGVNFYKGGVFTWGALKKGGDFNDAIYGARLVFNRAIPA